MRACETRRAGLSLASLAWVASAGGCRGDDIFFDCDYQTTRFEEQLAGEDRLRAAVPRSGPFPAVLSLSERAVQEIAAEPLQDNLLFSGEMPLGADTIRYTPKGEPTLDLADPAVCPACVIVTLDFNLEIAQGSEPLASGAGDAVVTVPLVLDDTDELAVSISADYDHATVEDMTLVVTGYESTDYAALQGAMKILMTEQIREQYDSLRLATLAPWRLGSGAIVLAARALEVQAEPRALVIGMQTNLDLPDDAVLPLSSDLPEPRMMGLSLHTTVLEQVARQMLVEGEIPRRYGPEGVPDPMGRYGVTLSSLGIGSLAADDLLEAQFRVWRIADGYCGYAEATMPLTVAVADDAVALTPGDARVIGGQGSGALAAEEEDFVAENQDLVAVFRQALAEQLGIAINLQDLDLEDRRMILTTRDVTVADRAVATTIDFVVVAEE